MTEPVVHIAHLNSVLRRAQKRADDLEERLVPILTPILDRAADEAARNFMALATDHLTATAARRSADMDLVAAMGLDRGRELLRSLALTAAVDVQSNSTMICLRPREEEAAVLVDIDGYEAANLHCTLVFIGEVDGPLDSLVDAVKTVAAKHAPLSGVVAGYGQFVTPGGNVGILLPDVPGLVEARVDVTEALVHADIAYSHDHGFEAHITVDDEPEPGEMEMMLEVAGSPLHFDEICIVRGNVEEVRIPFVGPPARTAAALTAAARSKDYCLPAQLHAKTNPVREAVVTSLMSETVEGVGLNFDVSNPYAQQAIVGGSGQQIQSIARTTQRDAMRAIKDAYEQGLSIPDTADLIRSTIKGSTEARARLIARTELAGAVNSGSLAATRMVSAQTGTTYYKIWMTAGGARFPRHETYDGLDGQTVHIDDQFDVGGDMLDCPGDPIGSPGEVCNCRCTMSYTDDAGDLTAAVTLESVAKARPLDLAFPEPRVAAEIAEIEALLADASPNATWTAPSASEVLNIDCMPTAKAIRNTVDEPTMWGKKYPDDDE